MDNTHQFKFGNLVGHRNNPMETTLYKSSLKLKDSDDVIKILLHFQNENECSILNSTTLMYRSKYELCAGYKIPYPKMKVYIRKLKKSKPGEKKKSYTFKYLMEQKNPVSISSFCSNIDSKSLN